MSFHFAFETLLEHKRTLEKEAIRYFNEAQSKVDKATEDLNEMYVLVDQSIKRAVQVANQNGAPVPELGMLDQFMKGQKVRIERQRASISELKVEAERRQELLLEAARERKTLEKLREKRLEEYKKKQKVREAKEIDELVVMRYKVPGEK